MRKITTFLMFVLVPLWLTGCFLPTKYEIDIQVRKDGLYAFNYEGDLIHLRFLQKLGQKEVAQGSPEEKEWAEVYAKDLKRDRGFSEVRYVGEARFRVKYAHEGNINKRKSFTFVRRNGWFLRIARTAPGVVEITGNKLAKELS